MNKKLKNFLIIFMVLLVLVFILIKIVSKYKIEISNDYYAVIHYVPSSEVGEKIYFYIDGNNDSRIIKTKWQTIHWGSPIIEEKIIEEKKIGYNENIANVVEDNYEGYYYIILNTNVPETPYRKGYSKGDKITLDELVSLVALN